MKHLILRRGTEAPKWAHINYLSEAAADGVKLALADLLAIAPSFYASGCILTATPSGVDTVYAITEGVVVINGEPMAVPSASVTKSPTQVVFLVPEDVPLDPIPTRNLDGSQDQVMLERRARLAVAGLMPDGAVGVGVPRKEDIERLRFKGRLVPRGSIMPYAGPMDDFNGTGLGLSGTAMEGWAVCNGLNGTVDMRGMVPMGATGVPASGAGSVYAGVQSSTNPGDKVGADGVVIEANNLPAHTHQYQDATVSYSISGDVSGSGGGGRPDQTRTTSPNVTVNDPLSVRQSSYAMVFIQSIL